MTDPVVPSYHVEEYDEGCPYCHRGKTWCIVDWRGVASGTTYSQEIDAEEHADELNSAVDSAISEYIRRNA